jgi:hypothetical protein
MSRAGSAGCGSGAETATWRAILKLTDVRLTSGGLLNDRQAWPSCSSSASTSLS